MLGQKFNNYVQHLVLIKKSNDLENTRVAFWSQSNDSKLQCQRCKNLQHNYVIAWHVCRIKMVLPQCKNAIDYYNAYYLNWHFLLIENVPL
jgi:hypothetical protein